MTWLITGGAGYIGAHVVRAFAEANLEPVVLDNLCHGQASVVPAGVPAVIGDVRDTMLLRRAIRAHRVQGVVHLAGFKFAGASVERPLHTYDQNVIGMMSLLEAMGAEGVDAVVFSSSCAVYGSPDVEVVSERTPTAPVSPYGESKLVSEWLLRDQARVANLRHTSLRYFNVVGAGSPDLGDTSRHNLFPVVMCALAQGRTPVIHGCDYPTPDGTCIRDYVHVSDIARAHATAARLLASERHLSPVYNLGSGRGLSVREVMEEVARVTGIGFQPQVGSRRAGDPARIVASGEKAAQDLGWRPRYGLSDMVGSAWIAARRAVPTST